jgi:peptidoglycan hydrolase-like protein with peptidoglycan-binding domain
MGMRNLVSAAAVAVILVAAGAAGALLLSSERVPAELRSGSAPAAAAAAAEQFTDERTVEATFTVAESAPITLRAEGTVTASRCVPGRPLASGSPALRVNDRPVVLLHTRVPPYRDLQRGHEGRDVKALQQELARLGYQVDADGDFDRRTAQAVKELETAAGFAEPDGVVSMADIAWLPQPTVTPTSCDATLGATVTPGGSLAKLAGRLSAVRLASLPAGLVPGARSITVFGVTGALAGDRTATDPAFLASLAATPEFQAQVAADSKDPATATLSLVKPLTAVKVPPAAIFALNGSQGCVQSGTRTIPVVVVGSGLGASLVTLSGPRPSSVNLGAAITASRCA